MDLTSGIQAGSDPSKTVFGLGKFEPEYLSFVLAPDESVDKVVPHTATALHSHSRTLQLVGFFHSGAEKCIQIKFLKKRL